jgi:hypothetical protein
MKSNIPPSELWSAAAGSAGFRNISGYLVTRSPGAFNKVNLDGFRLFIETLVDSILYAAFVKNLIVFLRLIQSHAQ